MFAIDEAQGEKTITVSIDQTQVVTLNVRCALSVVSYEFPLDLSAWSGKSVTIDVADLSDGSAFEKHLKMTDTFSFDYDEQYRPFYHFTAKYGWINDPNGMFYANGYYHFHFQYNPYGSVWGNMHWGHAVSRDMLTWEYLPYSFAPDELGGIFSGSSIVDVHGKSPFGPGSILSFYTSAGTWQQQSLGVSTDGGWTWKKYEGNPIIPNSEKKDFRDPKVIEYSDGQFIMCLALGEEHKIAFWGSSDLVHWTHLSDFGGYGAQGGVWECPDLIYFKEVDKWVLIVNLNPGGYAGGSAAQYFVGSFDGTTFTCDQAPGEIKWVDFGKDAYAIVTYSGVPDGRSIGVPWLTNGLYANQVPSKYFRGALGLPRVLDLMKVSENNYLLSSLPVREMEALRTNYDSVKDIHVNETGVALDLTVPKQSEIIVRVNAPESGVLVLDLANSKGQKVSLSLDVATGTYSMNRNESTKSGFSPDFDAVTTAKLPERKETYVFTLFVDSSSIELFDADGFCSMTNLVFPDEPFTTLSLHTEAGELDVAEVLVYGLQRTMFNKDAPVPTPKPKSSGLPPAAIALIIIGILIVIVAIAFAYSCYQSRVLTIEVSTEVARGDVDSVLNQAF